MSHPGIASFIAVAIKARPGDASRFPTKKHLLRCRCGAEGGQQRRTRIGAQPHQARRRRPQVRPGLRSQRGPFERGQILP